jgi:hypothetical protein
VSILKTRDSKLQARSSKAHRDLAADLAEYAFDPYGWMLYAFPWGKAELAWFGDPDTWQREQLEAIGARLRGGPGRLAERRDHGCGAAAPLLFAVSIAASIAASGCRFWLPFCRAKSLSDILLP